MLEHVILRESFERGNRESISTLPPTGEESERFIAA